MSEDMATREALLAEVAALRQRVQELEHTCERYASIMNHLPLGLFVYHLEELEDDRTFRMIDANPTVGTLTGVKPEETIGKTLDENFPGLREQGIPQAYAHVIRSGEPLETEVVYGDEQVIESAFDVHAVPLPNQCLAVMFENITQRKRMEMELFKVTAVQEEQIAEQTKELHIFKTLVDLAPDGIAFTGFDGLILYSNTAYAEMHGYSSDEIIGVPMLSLIANEDAERAKNLISSIVTDGYGKSMLTRLHRDGSTFPSQVSAFTIRGFEDSVQATAAIVRDMSNFIHMEEELQASQERFRILVEHMAVSVSIHQGSNYIYVNPAAEALTGYTRQELYAMNFLDIIHPDFQSMVEHYAFARQKGEITGTLRYEFQIVHKDGTPRWMDMTSNLATFDGKPSIIATSFDITDRKKSEDEQATLQQRIIDAQQAAIQELSSPLIPLSNHVVLMPLIGNIDSRRALLVMETLLDGIAQHQADLAILDITGVSVVDDQVASALVQAAQAVKLLGAQVVLTGIGPTMAQTLVHLGADLESIQTRGSLQQAIADAMR